MPLLCLLSPALRYSRSRDAFVLRAVGNNRGPVLRCERRRRLIARFEGADRRGTGVAAVLRGAPADAVEKHARVADGLALGLDPSIIGDLLARSRTRARSAW